MAIDTEQYCLGCGRVEDRCVCEIEFIHGQPNGTPRGSRAPVGHVPIDPLFHEAAAKGFEPLGEDEKAAFAEKAGILRKVMGGKG